MTNESSNTRPQHFAWDDVTLEQLNSQLTRQYRTGEQAMVARIVLKKGCIVPTHQHPNEQVTVILSGALEFNLAGSIKVVRAGEVLMIPGGLPHSATAIEDTVDLDFFAPPRADWLANDDSYLR